MRRRWLVLVAALAGASLLSRCGAAAQTDSVPGARSLQERIEAAWAEYRLDEARGIADSALIASEATGDTALILQLVLLRGRMQAAQGLGAEAIGDLRRAHALAESRRDTLSVCAAIRWLAVAEGAVGNRQVACELWERLFVLARRFGNRPFEATALSGRGHCAQLAGRIAEAAEWYLEAAGQFHELQLPRGEAFARNGLGTAYQDLGRYAEAEACYRRTAELADSIGDLHHQAVAENNLGALAYFLGDPGRARSHFARAVAVHDRSGNRRERFLAALNVAICEIERGGTRNARPTLDSLLAVAQREQYRDLEAKVWSEIAGLDRLQGRPAAAATALRSSLLCVDQPSPKQEIESILELSRSLTERDSLDAAVALLEQRAVRAARLEDPRLRLMLAAELGRGLLRQGRVAEAYATLRACEREAASTPYATGRLRLLAPLARAADLLGRREEALRWAAAAAILWEEARGRPLDPEWREIQGAQAREVSTLLAGFLLRADSAASESPSVERAYDRLQRFKARTLMERTLGPKHRADSAATAPIRLAALQREVLRPGELLLDFYLGPERSYLFLVDRDSARVALLPPEGVIEPAARDLCELIRAGAETGVNSWAPADRRLLGEASAALRQRLFPGLDELPGTHDRLYVSPDGALNLLPFVLLLGGVEDSLRSCQVIPSASMLGRIRAKAAGRGEGRGVLAWSGRRTPAGSRLIGPEREVAHLARLFRGVQRGDRLDPGSVRTSLERPALLHLAGHSEVDDQSPWLSAIALDRGGEVTSLRAADLADLRLAARLVVLSSCTSAGGRTLTGEGVQGLASAFLSAGAPAVVATLWPVEDVSTAVCMERFYEGLARGETPGRALADAQAALGSDPRWAHPHHWAGFVLVGDGEARPALSLRASRPPALPWLLGGIGGGVVLLVLAGFLRRRRRSV